jgi:uncharacterized protein (DUF1330 family)
MPVYWTAHVDVRDPARYNEYAEAAGQAFARHGARILARGGRTHVLEGRAPGRNVVIEFPNLEAALACYHSPEYQAAKALRQGASEGDMMIIEGVASSMPPPAQ